MAERVPGPLPTRSQVVTTAGGLAAATGLVALVDPYQGGRFPACPLLAVTGLYCPFCGGLRAVHDLTHLDLLGALQRNPVVVAGLPIVLLLLVAWGQSAFSGRRIVLPGARWGPVAIAFLVVFGVLRNLPGWTWLSPA